MNKPGCLNNNMVRAICFCTICVLTMTGQAQGQAANSGVHIDSLSHAHRMDRYFSLSPKSEEEWGDYQNIADSVQPISDYELKDSVEVFGWHPYWNGTAWKNYNFQLLSTIAYFSYELNPETGNYRTIHTWKTTAMIDSARAANPGIKILLTVTNFGVKNNREFLGVLKGNRARKQTLIDSLQVLLAQRKADGVVIDFEGVGRLEKKSLTDFIVQLSQALSPKNYMLFMTLPAEDPHGIYDVKKLASSVDKFIVMTYGYYWSKSKKAGPVAPLVESNTWGKNSVATSLDDYKKLGLVPSKAIIGIPYYGELWETRCETVPSDVRSYIGIRTYKEIRKSFPNSSKDALNPESSNVYYAYKRKDNGRDRQLWFENKETLETSYDWIKRENFGGIGIWALGDDDGYTELWELIAEKFATPKSPSPVSRILEPVKNLIPDMGKMKEKISKDLWTPWAFLALLAVAVLVLPISFFSVAVKNFIKDHTTAIYITGSFLLVLSLLSDMPILVDNPNPVPGGGMVLLLIATGTLGILMANLVHSIVISTEDLP